MTDAIAKPGSPLRLPPSRVREFPGFTAAGFIVLEPHSWAGRPIRQRDLPLFPILYTQEIYRKMQFLFEGDPLPDGAFYRDPAAGPWGLSGTALRSPRFVLGINGGVGNSIEPAGMLFAPPLAGCADLLDEHRAAAAVVPGAGANLFFPVIDAELVAGSQPEFETFREVIDPSTFAGGECLLYHAPLTFFFLSGFGYVGQTGGNPLIEQTIFANPTYVEHDAENYRACAARFSRFKVIFYAEFPAVAEFDVPLQGILPPQVNAAIEEAMDVLAGALDGVDFEIRLRDRGDAPTVGELQADIEDFFGG